MKRYGWIVTLSVLACIGRAQETAADKEYRLLVREMTQTPQTHKGIATRRRASRRSTTGRRRFCRRTATRWM
jgi:hypothetical protein